MHDFCRFQGRFILDTSVDSAPKLRKKLPNLCGNSSVGSQKLCRNMQINGQ